MAALFQTVLHPQGRRIRNIVEPSHPARAEFHAAEATKLDLPVPDFDSAGRSDGKVVDTVFSDILGL